jgi:hypothetical protein
MFIYIQILSYNKLFIYFIYPFSGPPQTRLSLPADPDSCRSLKTHMKMEMLRCKSPDMVRKEIAVYLK